MPYDATVFNVLISSPGDVRIDFPIIRDVVHAWNAAHSRSSKTILFPVGWETHSSPSMSDRPQGVLNAQLVDHADLLVVLFWHRLGSDTGKAPSGTVEELERHKALGKPTMVYFSEVPASLSGVDYQQKNALDEYKARWRTEGLTGTYRSQAELERLFTTHLAHTINHEPYFARSQSPASQPIIIHSDRHEPSLSDEAKTLLLAAVDGRKGEIIRMAYNAGTEIRANNKCFNEVGDARSTAKWIAALDELVDQSLVRPGSYNLQLFNVTDKGFKLAEQLRA